MTKKPSLLRAVLRPVLVLAAIGVLGGCVVAPYPGHDGGYRDGNGGYYHGHGDDQRGPEGGDHR